MSLRGIEPGLLLAAPSLGDPNFEGSVVLLGVHDEEDGSLGWTVNGPVIDQASKVVRATGLVGPRESLPPAFDRPALRGGPVAPESVWILYRRVEGLVALPGSTFIAGDVGITAEADALRILLEGKGPPSFRLLVGYAGWGAGQLAREFSTGAWLPTNADADLLFEGATDTLWRRAYAKAIGSVPTAFVTTTRGSA